MNDREIRFQFLTQIIMYVVWAVVLATLPLIYAQTLTNRDNGLNSQTYNRATNCFLAVPAEERTDERIQFCYDQAEKATGKTIERY